MTTVTKSLPKSTLTFLEKYQELRDLGVPQWEIANRLGITIESLVRKLGAARLPIDPLTQQMVQEIRMTKGSK